jgi:polar amino acid transport system substrate-binding protein
MASQTLTIVADEWYPMNGVPGNSKPGYMIELAKAIFSRHNITVEYSLLPWKRAVKQTRSGAYNCVVGAYKSDAPDFIFPDQHWGIDTPMFFVKKSDNWLYSGELSSLKKRKIGIITGYNYTDDFDNYIKNKDTTHIQFSHGTTALETNIKKLTKGRIDTLIESTYVLDAKLKKMGIADTIKKAGSITQPLEMYIACTPALPSSKAFINIINKEMTNMKNSGELKEILSRYKISPWNI